MTRWDEISHIVASSAAFGAVIGLAHKLIERHGGVLDFLRGVLAATVVAVLVGLAMFESAAGQSMQFAVIGICAYLADDILVGMMAIAKMVREDPVKFFVRIRDALRGR